MGVWNGIFYPNEKGNYVDFAMVITCTKAMNNFKATKANCQNSFKRILKS